MVQSSGKVEKAQNEHQQDNKSKTEAKNKNKKNKIKIYSCSRKHAGQVKTQEKQGFLLALNLTEV